VKVRERKGGTLKHKRKKPSGKSLPRRFGQKKKAAKKGGVSMKGMAKRDKESCKGGGMGWEI